MDPTPSTPVVAQSTALFLVGTQIALAELEALVCPADRVADIASVHVRGGDRDLLLQLGEVPWHWDSLIPSVPGIAYIITSASGDQAGQSQLALSPSSASL